MHPLTVVFWILFGSVAAFVAWSFVRMFFPRRWEGGDLSSSKSQPSVGPTEVRPTVSGEGASLGVVAGVGSISVDASASSSDVSGADTSSGDSSSSDSGGGDFSGGGGDYGGGGGSGGW